MTLINSFSKMIKILNSQAIPYMLVGGVAVNFYAAPRTTLDLDLVIMLDQNNLNNFLAELKKNGFQFDADIIVRHLGVMNHFPIYGEDEFQVDIWIPKYELEKKALERKQLLHYLNEQVYIISVEDLILFKLKADRSKDINDIKAILINQTAQLDNVYLDIWLERLGLRDKLKTLQKEIT